jgi:two-component system CheB/CheR fusion protein
MVEDLIDTAHWASGRLSLHTTLVDVRKAVADAAQDVTSAVAARGQELEVVVGPELLWVEADPDRFRQVLSNLLDNAINYTDAGGRIRLTAEGGDESVVVRVSDTGCGLGSEALAHVFDLFSQVRPVNSTGLGVGLSVVREIVALHGGRIEALSEGVGRGSDFVVTLPRMHVMMHPPDFCERSTSVSF